MALTSSDVFCAAPNEQSHLRLSYGAEPPEWIAEAVAPRRTLDDQTARVSCANEALSAYVPLV